jgi:5'-3' exonuclease
MTTFDYTLIDGKNLLWRMHSSHRSLSAKVDGEEIQTGGIYGFLASTARIFRKFKGRVVVAWEDEKRRNWRYDVWPQYKPRDPDSFQNVLDQEIEGQQERLIEVLSALGVPQYRAKNGEADDVLGRLSRLAADGRRVVIYSGDSDLLQLVTPSVRVCSSSKGNEILYSPKGVLKRMGVRPELVSHLKALAGDNSDGIPGAMHVGPVAAVKLLNEYGGVVNVAEAAMRHDKRWPVQERMRVSIADLYQSGQLAKFHKLTTIRVSDPWVRIRPVTDLDAAYGLLRRYKMHSLAMTAQHWTALNSMGRKR